MCYCFMNYIDMCNYYRYIVFLKKNEHSSALKICLIIKMCENVVANEQFIVHLVSLKLLIVASIGFS